MTGKFSEKNGLCSILRRVRLYFAVLFGFVIAGGLTTPASAQSLSDPMHFTISSVTANGVDQIDSTSGQSDSGTITLTIPAIGPVTYAYGKYSTSSSVAAGLAGKISALCGTVVALAKGSTITILESTDDWDQGSFSSGSQWNNALFPSASFSITKTKITPSLYVSCSPNPAEIGGTISCSSSLPPFATGTISFSLDGAAPWATTSQPAPVVIPSPGSHSVTANYSGDANFNPTTASTTISTVLIASTALYAYKIEKSDGSSGYDLAGNVVAYDDSINGQWNVQYDGLDRIQSATKTTPTATSPLNYCWNYDSFGNRLNEMTSQSSLQGGGGASCSSAGVATTNVQTFDAANHLVGNPLIKYDPNGSGDVISDTNNQYLYDAENRICAVGHNLITGGVELVQYIYDAEGRRVAKGTFTDWTKGCDATQNGFQLTAMYGRNTEGAVVTELRVSAGTVTWHHTNVREGGGLFATYNGTGIHFQLSDWLGSKRMQVDASGNAQETCSNDPYGNTQTCANSGSESTEEHFTGKERDTESGLDFFGARYYSSSIGRWASPDPGVVKQAHLMNAQKWNKYSYVLNNPLALFDPDGNEEMWIQYRAFIPMERAGWYSLSARGDNRSFSSQENASSRVSITMHIETDPAKNGGQPLLGYTYSLSPTHNNMTGNDPQGSISTAPTATGSQDANGTVHLNVLMNVHSSDLPGMLAIRSDMNFDINQGGTSIAIHGLESISPAFEANVAPQGGPTTNIPLQNPPSSQSGFFAGLLWDKSISTSSSILQPQEPAFVDWLDQ